MAVDEVGLYQMAVDKTGVGEIGCYHVVLALFWICPWNMMLSRKDKAVST